MKLKIPKAMSTISFEKIFYVEGFLEQFEIPTSQKQYLKSRLERN
jgi:hypothetical protein